MLEYTNDRRINVEHRSDIDYIKEVLIKLDIKTDDLTKKIDSLEKVIYGNGVAGIKSRVDIIEARCKDREENKKIINDVKKQDRDIFWKIATFGLTIFSAIVAFHK